VTLVGSRSWDCLARELRGCYGGNWSTGVTWNYGESARQTATVSDDLLLAVSQTVFRETIVSRGRILSDGWLSNFTVPFLPSNIVNSEHSVSLLSHTISVYGNKIIGHQLDVVLCSHHNNVCRLIVEKKTQGHIARVEVVTSVAAVSIIKFFLWKRFQTQWKGATQGCECYWMQELSVLFVSVAAHGGSVVVTEQNFGSCLHTALRNFVCLLLPIRSSWACVAPEVSALSDIFTKITDLGEISGSHVCEYKNESLLGYSAV
jgi:hypothetical protein